MRSIPMTKKKNEYLAFQGCANYSLGLCMGVMMKSKPKAGYKTNICQWVDKNLEGKQCGRMVDNCKYYNNIVLPVMHP